ncbi:CLUMA_CG006007, isoform A [Clunio marinus]|uniref:CLUMA_CG006007, isoform A n=1 Tax=Clunio marinus TaxID=568069 RepID=A0A1J1HWJ8_9DIPT|nr:CLUMA_CG006007, isoform A [Clunio marinus]
MMDTLWIIFIGVSIFGSCSNGQSDVEVEVIAKKYVERGSTVTLICKHNVEPERLYKVTWLKGNGKVFEYINGRQPPYRNFTVPGAEIDFQKSNQNEVTLKNLDFDASGLYYCEVSLESPIFTKASNEEQVHVILPQNAPPTIVFKKRQFYIGEKLIANCTTSRSKPVPHIVWLINGKKVDEIYQKTLHPYGVTSKHRSKAHHEKNDFNEHPNENGKSSRDDESDDVEVNNNRNSLDISHRHGYNFENNESTDSFYKSYNNFNSENRESKNYLDNKNYDIHKKHRNGLINRKYRRFVNDGSYQQQHQKTSNRRMHPGTYSISQLSIEVSELHAGANGRLEITCLSTIPANVAPGEQYADYKTFSVKVDIEAAELTTNQTPMGGMAALGNKSNKMYSLKYPLELMIQCLPIIIVIMAYQ